MAQTDEEKWLQYAEEYGSPLEDQNKVVVVGEDNINETMSIPGIQYNIDPTTSTRATPLRYVQLHLSSLFTKITTMLRTVTNAISDLTTLKQQTTAARDAANQAASDAQTATQGAENVNANLVGTTVTITDRHGTSRSVDIGFEIYQTYDSVAAMKADAANVPQGKFVIIATEDPTSEDNAKMYCRTNAPASDVNNAFRFLSDLDQASSAAWADWLNNMKPEIEGAINTADSDHTRANSDHSTAVQDHSTASNDHTQAVSDHDNYTADRQTFATDEAQRQQTFEANETQRQQDFEDAEDERMASMMLTHCFIDFSTMCLMFVQPETDTTQYKVRNGNLEISFQYEAN